MKDLKYAFGTGWCRENALAQLFVNNEPQPTRKFRLPSTIKRITYILCLGKDDFGYQQRYSTIAEGETVGAKSVLFKRLEGHWLLGVTCQLPLRFQCAGDFIDSFFVKFSKV